VKNSRGLPCFIDGEVDVHSEKKTQISEPWTLSIERRNLHRRDTLISLTHRHCAGNFCDYRQRAVHDGVIYIYRDAQSKIHLPLSHVAAPNCMSADAWATSTYVKAEAGIAVANAGISLMRFVQRKNSDFRCFEQVGLDRNWKSHLIQR